MKERINEVRFRRCGSTKREFKTQGSDLFLLCITELWWFLFCSFLKNFLCHVFFWTLYMYVYMVPAFAWFSNSCSQQSLLVASLLRFYGMDKLIRDVLLWTPTHGCAKAGRPAWTYIQQLCEDTGCCPEDLPRAMNDREEWWERVRDICVTTVTWWWWTLVTNLMPNPV